MKFLPKLCLAGSLALAPATAQVKLSGHLTRIAEHLGEGGAHFSVTDSKDDLKSLGDIIDTMLELAPEVELPSNLKVSGILDDLGLYGIEGRGSSSHLEGKLWHNRSFILTDGNHKGLLSLFGDEARTPVAHEFAPAGADLVLETSLDLTQLVKLAKKISTNFGEDVEGQVREGLLEKMGKADLSIQDMLNGFNVRGTIVVWLDEETFEMSPDLKLPIPHLAMRLDNAETAWKIIKAEMVAGGDSVIEEKDGEVYIRPAGDDGEVGMPWGMAKPHFVWNEKSKQLFLALSDADLATCRGDGPRITENADFKAASVGFPKESNGLAYLSGDVLHLAVRIAEEFKSEAPPEGQKMIAKVLEFADELAAKGGLAASYSVEDDGFLLVGNFPYPVKGESQLTSLGGVFTVSALAGIATPLVLRAQKAGEDTETLMNLKAFAGSQVAYQIDQGKYATSLVQLVEKGFLDEEIVEVLVKANFKIVIGPDFKRGNHRDILAIANSARDDEKVIVARADGSASLIMIKELEEQLAKQENRK